MLAERGEDRSKLLNILNSMVVALQRSGTKVKLDFSKTVRMYPGGMLMLLAYLEVLLDLYPGRLKACCMPRSLAAQLMGHFGIATKLGLSAASSRPRDDSVVTWKYLTGEVADGSKISELIEGYRKLTSAEIPDGLYEALTEALTNVRQHAYPAGSNTPDALRRWWLFAKYEEPSGGNVGKLFVGVYDIGLGIQQSMRKHLLPTEKLLDVTGTFLEWTGLEGTSKLERLLLTEAVERNRSSTGLDFRGNGLPEMRDFVLKTTSGRLSIVSGSSQYTTLAKSQSSSANSSRPILGTLILWSIPLDAKEIAI